MRSFVNTFATTGNHCVMLLMLFRALLLVVLVCALPSPAGAQTSFVHIYDDWRWSLAEAPGWEAAGFDDSGWAVGTTPIGRLAGASLRTRIETAATTLY